MSSRLSTGSGIGSATEWVASLSPWPEEFGLAGMRALLDRLENPQRRYPSIHVVGTNGKSTATRTIAALVEADGRRAGAYTSPHVSGWAERIWANGREADFERAVARVRRDAEELRATQFEALTAAAFAEFAEQEVDVAVVEAGLGGRLDATNVVDAPVVLLTNVSLEHTEVLGETPEQIAREKLAVAHAARVVVLSDNRHAGLARELAPKSAEIVTGGARDAAEAFLGRAVEADIVATPPGRFDVRSESPLEIWDGAHNPDAVKWLVERLPWRDFVLVASILADKDADRMLRKLWPYAKRLIATQSTNPRAWSADELAAIARDLGEDHRFREIKVVPDPVTAVERARAMAGKDGAVLVTGSLYLLADLYGRRKKTYDAEAG